MRVPDLAAALDALEQPARPGPRCRVGTYLAGLAERDPTMHARVIAMIDDQAIAATGLATALREDGLDAHGDTVRRHRNRSLATGCRCPR